MKRTTAGKSGMFHPVRMERQANGPGTPARRQERDTMKIRFYSTVVFALAIGLTACAHPTPGAPTTYNPGCNTADLIHDINQANTDPGPATINLPGGCEYLLTQVDNTQLADGVDLPSGLPPISSDITIMGNNAILKVQAPTGGPAYFGIFFIEPAGYLQLYSLTLQDAW
jgi:hypothetical protein